MNVLIKEKKSDRHSLGFFWGPLWDNLIYFVCGPFIFSNTHTHTHSGKLIAKVMLNVAFLLGSVSTYNRVYVVVGNCLLEQVPETVSNKSIPLTGSLLTLLEKNLTWPPLQAEMKPYVQFLTKSPSSVPVHSAHEDKRI